MINHDSAKLNKIYDASETVDKKMFTTFRSNILLTSGEHYTRRGDKYTNKSRVNTKPSNNTKLRLTKNHIYRITKTYENSIVSKAPGVRPVPKNDMEMQDQKAAELNRAVWEDIKSRHKLNDKIRKWANYYTSIGEQALKIFWDPNKGEHIGYEPLVDDMGEPVMRPQTDEMGNVLLDTQVDPATGQVFQTPVLDHVPDETKPVMSGDIVYEQVPAYNLLRAPEAQTMQDSPYYIVRKMVNIKKLKKKYWDQPDKLAAISKSAEDKFVVFD